MDKKNIIKQLYAIGAIAVGEFTFASGLTSQVYVDIRRIISYPVLLKAVADAMWALLKDAQADLICGVPYTALPIATHLSLQHHVPMIMVRKEPKSYGTKKSVEGVYLPGQRCYLIEDLITTGGSILKAAALLEAEKIQVSDVAVLIDRQQGGMKDLKARGYHVHAVMTLREVFESLLAEDVLTAHEKQRVMNHMKTLTN